MMKKTQIHRLVNETKESGKITSRVIIEEKY
jgi:hypothetical protein